MAKLKRVFCKFCKTPIYRSNGRINENLKLGHNFYCSKKCLSKNKNKQQLLFCENCGKYFRRSPKEISPHNYCSQSCAAKVNNKKYPKRKSKLKLCVNIRCEKQFNKSKGNLKYCSMKCRREAGRKYTSQQLINTIKRSAQELKRVPAKRELKEIADICVKSFGSWNNAVIGAGLQPNRSHSQRMYKRTNTVASDRHLCDSISEAIVDNWLTENNIFHERNVFYPKTKHKADWVIFIRKRKIFIEYFGLANDSPRYDRAIKRKKALCRKHKLTLVAIYPQDLYPKKYLDAKLKDKFKHLIDF
jgi:hypothetical protein